MLQQLWSWRNAFCLSLSERLRRSRGTYCPHPAGPLTELLPEQQHRIGELAARYGAVFERSLDGETALRNYEYLDLLDRAFAAGGVAAPRPEILHDAGCASFWYAAALAAFFRPARLVGIDVEGYRRLKGGHARIDYARGYLASIGQGEFVVADYRRYDEPADVITSFFPFVTQPAILAWRLPLTLLDPRSFFTRVRQNLRPKGMFFMVNHGHAEAEEAGRRCGASGFTLISRLDRPGVLSAYRSEAALLSLWRPALTPGIDGFFPNI